MNRSLPLVRRSWQSVVMNVASRHPEWREPHWAYGQCVEASYLLHEELTDSGVCAHIYDGSQPKSILETDFEQHVFVVIAGILVAVDLTGRQFWPGCDVPIVEPLDVYARRYAGELAPYEAL